MSSTVCGCVNVCLMAKRLIYACAEKSILPKINSQMMMLMMMVCFVHLVTLEKNKWKMVHIYLSDGLYHLSCNYWQKVHGRKEIFSICPSVDYKPLAGEAAKASEVAGGLGKVRVSFLPYHTWYTTPTESRKIFNSIHVNYCSAPTPRHVQLVLMTQ